MSDKVSLPGGSKYLESKKRTAKDKITDAFADFKSLLKDKTISYIISPGMSFDFSAANAVRPSLHH